MFCNGQEHFFPGLMDARNINVKFYHPSISKHFHYIVLSLKNINLFYIAQNLSSVTKF